MQLEGFNSALSPVVYGDIVLSINIHYITTLSGFVDVYEHNSIQYPGIGMVLHWQDIKIENLLQSLCFKIVSNSHALLKQAS